MLNSSQIATLINEVYNGVERSKVGDILQKNEDGSLQLNKDGIGVVNTIPMQTYLAILNAVTPKDFVTTVKNDGNSKENL